MSVAVLASLATLAAACGNSNQDVGRASTDTGGTTPKYINPVMSEDAPTLGGSLVYGVNADTNSWNPAQAQWGSYSMIAARTMFEFLTEFDSSGAVKPSVAESLTPNADFTEWTVKLRDDIKYSNGEALTAESVARAQRYIRSSPVVGNAARFIIDWRVVDRLTFVAISDRPFASYPQGMLTQLGAIAYPEWLESNDWRSPVGTGPFQMDNWVLESHMQVKRNPHYWRKDKWGNQYPYLDAIEFRVIPDERERANALRQGEIDIMLQTLASPDVAALRSEAQQGMFQSFSDDDFESAEDHVVLNTKMAPFTDIDARRALAHAVDQNDYIATVTGGLNTPADSSIAPSSPWYTPTDYPKFDPAKAKELVDKVKAKNDGKFEFQLTAQHTPEATKIMQYLAEAWGRVGITVRPNVVENKAKIVGMVGGLNQATIIQLYDSPSPVNDTVFWPGTEDPLGAYSLSFSRLRDQQIVDLYEQMNTTQDAAVQRRLQGEIQKQLAQQIPFVWLAHVSRTVVASTKLVNVVHHTLPDGSVGLDFMQGSHALYQIWRRH